MIEIKNLTKNYGPHCAISNLNFNIPKGDVVGFLGPNGAGKSTTMKIITGFMAPSDGYAKIAGFDVFESPIEVKKRIGYLPETPPLYGEMTVTDYLIYVAKLKRVSKEKIPMLVRRAIEKTNLGEVQKRLIQHLSKGFKQRVGIAQALVSDPEVLILDEPTVGLDPKQMHEIRELIRELKGQHTIILSTHILPEVRAVCERAIIIHKGKIVAEDTIANLSSLEKGKSLLQVRVRKNSQEFATVLKRLNGVLDVEANEDNKSWKISVRNQDDVIESVAQEIINQGWGLLEMTPSQMDLEDVFLKLTYGSQVGGQI